MKILIEFLILKHVEKLRTRDAAEDVQRILPRFIELDSRSLSKVFTTLLRSHNIDSVKGYQPLNYFASFHKHFIISSVNFVSVEALAASTSRKFMGWVKEKYTINACAQANIAKAKIKAAPKSSCNSA
ncbi:17247_t:CDS:2 [Funneliformis caledonium]|uniref:17247_t:CDS:1 n=1 Tax=Funneliformis caledonium TaxID=1117310 RepID=A0A9N9BZK5_9GLOM|nr:17247_t:CDS:2 [Funneliformis caledonium]